MTARQTARRRALLSQYTTLVESPCGPSAVTPPRCARSAQTREDGFCRAYRLLPTQERPHVYGPRSLHRRGDSSNDPRNEIRHIVVAFNKHNAENFKIWRLLPATPPPPTRTHAAANLQELNFQTNLQILKIGSKLPKSSRARKISPLATGRRSNTSRLIPRPSARCCASPKRGHAFPASAASWPPTATRTSHIRDL